MTPEQLAANMAVTDAVRDAEAKLRAALKAYDHLRACEKTCAHLDGISELERLLAHRGEARAGTTAQVLRSLQDETTESTRVKTAVMPEPDWMAEPSLPTRRADQVDAHALLPRVRCDALLPRVRCAGCGGHADGFGKCNLCGHWNDAVQGPFTPNVPMLQASLPVYASERTDQWIVVNGVRYVPESKAEEAFEAGKAACDREHYGEEKE